MTGILKNGYIECSGPERQLYWIKGVNRVPIRGLRPQAVQLICYMIVQNEMHGGVSKVIPNEELYRAVWNTRQISDVKGQLARLVFEIRQVLIPLAGEEDLIRNVPGQGYILFPHLRSTARARTSFVCGPPIADPVAFFGRAFELRRIFNLWNRSPLHHVALIGPRRSGKTSLLHFLERIHRTPANELRPGQSNRWLDDADALRVVFIDCQDARLSTPEAMMKYVLIELGLASPAPCSMAAFVAILSGIAYRTILLFDEFEVALSNPGFDAGFWAGLRSLATNHSSGLLGYVIALHAEPSEAINASDPQSPFINIFGHSLLLGPLTSSEARELIDSSPKPFQPADSEWILSHSGLHPAVLQILCDTRLTALEEQQPGELWKQEALRRIMPLQHLLSGS